MTIKEALDKRGIYFNPDQVEVGDVVNQVLAESERRVNAAADAMKLVRINNEYTFEEYQETCKTTAIYRESTTKLLEELEDTSDGNMEKDRVKAILDLCYVGLGLGEVGECQGKIKKIIRDSGGIITNQHREMIGKELGDVLWYVAGVCSEMGISMRDVAYENTLKLKSRKERGVIGGSGDER